MKVTVKQDFIDKFTDELYKAGRQIEIDDKDRVMDLVDRGLVEKAEKAAEKVSEPAEEPKKSKKK